MMLWAYVRCPIIWFCEHDNETYCLNSSSTQLAMPSCVRNEHLGAELLTCNSSVLDSIMSVF
jgi:hypothetical protein